VVAPAICSIAYSVSDPPDFGSPCPSRHRVHAGGVIVSVAFHNFKALRDARMALQPFNLVLGPSGSGKTSLIQALLRLRTLTRLQAGTNSDGANRRKDSAVIEFQLGPPHDQVTVRLSCVSDLVCDQIEFIPADPALRAAVEPTISGIRAFLFDHYAMAEVCDDKGSLELASNGANLSAVLAAFAAQFPETFARLEQDLVRIMPEFTHLGFTRPSKGSVQLALKLRDEPGEVTADNLSQGTLYLLAMMALAFHPQPPSVVCIEEIDRGIHPRMLREVRDLLYRLSYPTATAIDRVPVQVIATTHSPYLLDLFKDHPEEIFISHKVGNAAHFEKLSDRDDLPELLAEGSLGDLWFSGILGGVPEE
jgi:energy-coupling factor transporter ATP-binding protein EcfA2